MNEKIKGLSDTVVVRTLLIFAALGVVSGIVASYNWFLNWLNMQ